MPRQDGCEATIALRQRGVTTPVIAVSASVLEADRTRCLQSGMNDFLSKPISRQRLADCLIKYCDLSPAAPQN